MKWWRVAPPRADDIVGCKRHWLGGVQAESRVRAVCGCAITTVECNRFGNMLFPHVLGVGKDKHQQCSDGEIQPSWREAATATTEASCWGDTCEI